MAEPQTAIIIQCPQCQARYRLEEKQFAGQAQLKVRCTKCEAVFDAKAPTKAAPVPPAPPSDRLPEATVVSQQGGRLPDGKAVALSVTVGPQKGKVFPLSKPRVVLGRMGSDIVIEDSEISRKHCAVEVHGTTATLVDLDSTNGTFVEDQKIRTCKLEHLSEFRIGSTTLLFTVMDREK